jgi:hypothetical protein
MLIRPIEIVMGHRQGAQTPYFTVDKQITLIRGFFFHWPLILQARYIISKPHDDQILRGVTKRKYINLVILQIILSTNTEPKECSVDGGMTPSGK